ncbi:MAG: hypothetical protein ACD_21C00284G0019 [uncultured bacterium]|nr:MAG: hypothetical protein ACD_21C00284G0019 [uncultured bacterium]
MKEENNQFIEEVTWEESRNTVANSCKKLGNIIDSISPGKEYPIFRIRYPFGAKIAKKTRFYLPDEHKSSIPITDTKISQKIREQLNYSPIPLGIITHNNVETCLEIDNKVFCAAFHGKGFDIGIWEHFGWTTPYTITSGARSLYMLPKISETISHKKLKNVFGISAPPPKRLFDQWQVFTQLANSPYFSKKWHCELIVLSNKWFDKIKNDSAWQELRLYLGQQGWLHCEYARKKSVLDVIWEVFARNLNANNLKFDPYVIDTLKHLLLIGAGVLPASSPAINTENSGPIKEIQTIYEDIYHLQNIPTIMQPKYFRANDNSPVYYSLQNPTLLESTPKLKQTTSIIETIRNLKELIDLFIEKTHWQMLEQPAQPFCETINKIRFDFFHSDTFAYGPHIRPSTEIPKSDLSLRHDTTKKQVRKFANNGSFLRGCVRIMNRI